MDFVSLCLNRILWAAIGYSAATVASRTSILVAILTLGFLFGRSHRSFSTIDTPGEFLQTMIVGLYSQARRLSI